MSTANMSNLSVPLPSGQSATNSAMLMPKMNYRFRVTFTNFGAAANTTILTQQVMNCTRPNLDFEKVVLDTYNSRINLAGKPTWGDITVQLYDDAAGETTALVGAQIQRQFDFYEQASAVSGIDYKFIMTIEILDGGNGSYAPNVLETFELDGCWIMKPEYEKVDYKGSEYLSITLGIVFDNAIQLDGSGNISGIGQTVTRTSGSVATG